MSDDIVISVQNVSKAYRIWRDPSARLKAPLWEAVGKLIPKSILNLNSKLNLRAGNPARYYKDFYALKDVSFEVKKGEAVGIIGRNGSGKSTLLQMIAGTLTPSSGSIQVKGRVAALLELGSGFNPDFTGRENVYLNASVLGLTREEIDKRIDEILIFADIGDFIDQPVKTYSSGMMMRLAFAVQIAVEPDILIVDEALGVGDEAFQRKCYSRLHKLRQDGTTLLFVSHDVGTVINLCNLAALLNQGQINAIGNPKFVVAQYHKQLYAQTETNSSQQVFKLHSNEANSGLSDPAKIAPETLILTNDESHFDPLLSSGDTLTYPHRGAYIESAMLVNNRGQRVNCLTHGCRYRVMVEVKVERTCVGIFLGSMISTLKGQSISGFNTPQRESPIPILESGTRLRWTYEFTCRLFAGTYVIELGIGGLHDTDPFAFIHRVEDACLFKVLPSLPQPVSGLVNLDQTGRLEIQPIS